MSTVQLKRDLLQIEVDTFEIVDLGDVSQDMADIIVPEDPGFAMCSTSTSTSSCCSCSTSSCCSCSTSTSSCG